MIDLQNILNEGPSSVRLGKCIRARRELLDMTQLYIGDVMGLTGQQISRYETGENQISVVRLWRLCRCLEIDPCWLVTIAMSYNDKASYISAFAQGPGEEEDVLRSYRLVTSQAVRTEVRAFIRQKAINDQKSLRDIEGSLPT